VRVYGSSGVGAVRAVELGWSGMIGAGRIYDLLCQTRWFRDDHLAHVDDGLCYLDISFATASLVARGRLRGDDHRRLLRICDRLHYTELRPSHLRTALERSRLPAPGRRRLVAAIEEVFRVSHHQKNTDAVALITLIRDDLQEIQALNARLNRRRHRCRFEHLFYDGAFEIRDVE
jgi:hypothetical protein